MSKCRAVILYLSAFILSIVLFQNCDHHEKSEAYIYPPSVDAGPGLPTGRLDLQSNCAVASWEEFEQCLKVASEQTEDASLTIYFTQNLVLGVGQVLRLNGIRNVILEGRLGGRIGQAVKVTETMDRLKAEDAESRHLLEVTDGSEKIELKNIVFEDPVDSENILRQNCRVGAHPTNPNLWNPGPCYAPLLIGGGDARPVSRMTITNIQIKSQKALLMQLRATRDFRMENSRFVGGGVFGVMFMTDFFHERTEFKGCHFQGAGTNGIILTNARETTIRDSEFVDNHVDPQFICGTNPAGQPNFCPGGQLYVSNGRNVEKLSILKNTFRMTEARSLLPTSGGIEIASSQTANAGTTSEVLIEGNLIHNMGLSGIGISAGNQQKHRAIVVRKNRLYQNYKGRQSVLSNRERHFIWVMRPTVHQGVDVSENEVSAEGSDFFNVSFQGSTRQCSVFVGGACEASVVYSLRNVPSVIEPEIRKDGVVLRRLGRMRSGNLAVPGIREGASHVITMHLGSGLNEPAVAMFHLVGGRESP